MTESEISSSSPLTHPINSYPYLQTMASPIAPTKHEMAPLSRENRPMIVGPDIPDEEGPYPLKLFGVVTSGFGRGARFLGIPTGKSMLIPTPPLTDFSYIAAN